MNLLIPILAATALTANIDKVIQRYDSVESKQLVPITSEAVRFATFEHNDEAHAAQKAWLMKTATELGFVTRDAGKITEIELPATSPDAPVLGLVVHGDVQPVEADAWSFPPFEGRVENGFIYGRGSADDKGPLAQALTVMKALKESGVARTHTIRLLVGSEEESSATEMPEYLKTHAAPDYSLVLDSEFPVIVGEKAWNALSVTTPVGERAGVAKPYVVTYFEAGLGASIVPDHATLKLRWKDGTPKWEPLMKALRAVKLPEGTRLVVRDDGAILNVVAYGKSSHAGVNIAGGRNALVALARLVEGKLPSGGADDLLAFARMAGKDLYGTGLGIKDNDPVWGRYTVNVATVKMVEDHEDQRKLTINIRSIPPRTGEQLKNELYALVDQFNKRTGAKLVADGYWDDKTFGVNPNAKLVKRLLNAYATATGTKAKPSISGGGTYAKRIPNAIVFGMWFPGKPYPGHDVDEKIPIDDLQRGARVLIHALVDIATGPKIDQPFQ